MTEQLRALNEQILGEIAAGQHTDVFLQVLANWSGQVEALLAAAPQTGWQPIETLTDHDREVWMWSPPDRLFERPIGRQGDIRIATRRQWTWGTHWMPCDKPLPPNPPDRPAAQE